jgi:hypothetical protein
LTNPGAVVLIQHDGFTAANSERRTLEQAILDATGYALTLEEELIQPDIQARSSTSRFRRVIKKYKSLQDPMLARVSAFGYHPNTVSSENPMPAEPGLHRPHR